MPKTCALRSLRGNDNILHISAHIFQPTSKGAIERLNYEIGEKIGQILKFDSDGILQLQESEIPEYNTVDKAPIPTRSVEISTMSNSTQTTLKPEVNGESGKDKEKEGYFMAEEAPDEKSPPTSLDSTVQDQGFSPDREVRHGSSSSQPHATAENCSPSISAPGDVFTPGTLVVSESIGRLVKAEIKLAAIGVLKCFTEHVEGMPY